MNKFFKTFLKILLFLTPFFLGITGYALADGTLSLDSMFNTILMYSFNFGDSAPNIFIEIARWTAPLATASGIVMVFHRLSAAIRYRIQYILGNSVAVYGDDESTDALLKQLGCAGIDGNDEFIKAQKYILTGTEDENLEFYRHYQKELEGHMVYLRCQNLQAQSVAGGNLKLYSPEELASRLFWKEHSQLQKIRENNGRLSVVLIGFEKLGQEMLYWALQNLIYLPQQEISYHIFGNGNHFLSLHPCLDRIEDPIYFYDEPWYNQYDLVENADMVIVLTQENQAALLGDMLGLLHRDQIDVFAASRSSLELLDESSRLRVFDWKTETQRLDLILDDSLLKRAKRINMRYAYLYGNVEETDENSEIEWNKLNSFTRYSNISAADYHEVRLTMIQETGYDAADIPNNKEFMELLAELEHMRWCRYHYLNNWIYGIPENGKTKDPVLRLHQDLIPYQNLTEEEKEKDRENIRVMLTIN